MQGVQILNEFMHEGAVVAPWCQIGLGCSIIGLVGLMFSPKERLDNWFFALGVALFLFGMGVGIFAPKELTSRYQVIVEDDVNFNAFLDKYKIIDQNGLIYTVEERE